MKLPPRSQFLAQLACILLLGATVAFAQEISPLEAANRTFQEGKHQEAERAFRELLARETDPAVRGKATFNLGLTLKKLSRYDEAIKVFESLIEQPVNDREPGGHLMEPYRNYRPRAKWEIGNCLLAKRDYAAAREAFRTTKEQYPFQSWCGNEQAAFQYRYAFFDGLCLEHLGRPAEAMSSYYQAAFGGMGLYSSPEVHFRMVNLYEATGQQQALLSLLDQIDTYFLSLFQREANRSEQPLRNDILEKFRPTALMRRIVELRRFAAEGKRKELIACLKIKGSVTGPPDDNGNWEALEAARLLALTPKESTQALLSRVAHREGGEAMSWIAYALSQCATDEGLEWIKSNVAQEENYWAARTLIYSLSKGGKKGNQVIAELEKTAKHNLRIAILHCREGRLSDENIAPVFPELHRNIILPEKLAALDEEVAYRESLPAKVNVDRSTPEAALNSLLLALVIEDVDAIKNCTSNSPLWLSRVQRQREFGTRLPRFSVGNAAYKSESEAELSFEFGTEARKEKASVTIQKAEDGWLVAGSKVRG